jgi:hypothetical protein
MGITLHAIVEERVEVQDSPRRFGEAPPPPRVFWSECMTFDFDKNYPLISVVHANSDRGWPLDSHSASSPEHEWHDEGRAWTPGDVVDASFIGLLCAKLLKDYPEIKAPSEGEPGPWQVVMLGAMVAALRTIHANGGRLRVLWYTL